MVFCNVGWMWFGVLYDVFFFDGCWILSVLIKRYWFDRLMIEIVGIGFFVLKNYLDEMGMVFVVVLVLGCGFGGLLKW